MSPAPDRAHAGPIWLHIGNLDRPNLIEELCDAILDRDPGASLLLTHDGEAPELVLGDECTLVPIARDLPGASSAFLETWNPAVVGWLDGRMRPQMLRAISKAGIDAYLIDTGNVLEAVEQSTFTRLLGLSPIRYFRRVVAGDEITRAAIRRAGMPARRIDTLGVLELPPVAMRCNEAERDLFAEMLATRPVWLAAEINPEELEHIIFAQQQLLRRSHRAILLLVPAEPEKGETFSEKLAAANLATRRRSIGEEPGNDTQVYLADTEEELGLWYRVAPITFIGQTLAGPIRTDLNPFDAAALGSAILHGPSMGRHQAVYGRLGRANAARKIAHAGELAYALESLLSPDRVAAMAHAAWEIATAGSDVLNHVAHMLINARNRERE